MVNVPTNPDVATKIAEFASEPCSHAHRWEAAWTVESDVERERIRQAVASSELPAVVSTTTVAWQVGTGMPSRPRGPSAASRRRA